MATFTFQNLLERDIDLVIEPWAMWEKIAPGEAAFFEVADCPPPDLEIAATPDGGQYIYLMSERVRIVVNGREHMFETAKRPEALSKLCRYMNGSWEGFSPPTGRSTGEAGEVGSRDEAAND